MSSKSATTSAPNHTWNPWPISIISFFTVAILGCGTFIAFCSRHPAELVAADYYEQEVRYQGQIERIQRAQADAQLADITYDRALKRITISLPPGHSHGNVLGKIQLYRPSAIDQDQQVAFAPDANGLQVLDAARLRPGLWKVRLFWTVDNKEFYIDRKLVIGSLPAAALQGDGHDKLTL